MKIDLAFVFQTFEYKLRRSVSSRMTAKVLVSVVLCLTGSALAAEVSGKWNGALEFEDVDGQMQTAPAHAELRQRNTTLGGKVWKDGSQRFEIEEGRVADNEIFFTFKAPEGEEERMTIHSVKLTVVSPTQMRGTLEFNAGGQRVSAKLILTREVL